MKNIITTTNSLTPYQKRIIDMTINIMINESRKEEYKEIFQNDNIDNETFNEENGYLHRKIIRTITKAINNKATIGLI